MTINRRAVLALSASGLAAPLFGQTPPPAAHGDTVAKAFSGPHETIDLWPSGAPGMPTNPPQELTTQRSKDPAYSDRFVMGITRPRLAVFRPAKPNGASLMITPGGGYRWVVVDKEGYEMARWLAARGITVFVLFYRLPGDGWAAGPDVVLQDTQRAMRLIRHRAKDYGLDPARLAAMGFSAGGHACADLATRFDAKVYDVVDAADVQSAKPYIAAPIYPVISMTVPTAHAGSRALLIGPNASAAQENAHTPSLYVPSNAPPHFLLHAQDDASVPVENTLMLHDALRAKKVPVEMHLFAEGGHGFGLRLAKGKPVEIWPEQFLAWAKTQGWLSAGK